MNNVSGLSIIFMILTLGISFLFPIGLMIYYYRKEKIYIPAVLVGALVFFISQMVLRIPLLQMLSKMNWFESMAKNLWLSGIFFGLTAGIFEEAGRFLGFKLLLKKRLEWKNGIAYGIGHGGIEAMLLVGLTYVNNLVYSLLINSGGFKVIASQLPGNTADTIFNGLVNSPSTDFMLAGVERFFTIFVHMAFSLIVLYGVMNRKNILLAAAILLHTLLNAPLPLLNKYFGVYVTEAYIILFGIAAIFFIFKSKKLFAPKGLRINNTVKQG